MASYSGFKKSSSDRRRRTPLALHRGLIDFFSSPADLKKNFLIYLEACQHVAVNQPRIQADFVGQIVEYGRLRSVPEKHRLRKNMGAVDECVPDPKQFFVSLLGPSFLRVDAGVHAQE